jgi:hypothetical protein
VLGEEFLDLCGQGVLRGRSITEFVQAPTSLQDIMISSIDCIDPKYIEKLQKK